MKPTEALDTALQAAEVEIKALVQKVVRNHEEWAVARAKEAEMCILVLQALEAKIGHPGLLSSTLDLRKVTLPAMPRLLVSLGNKVIGLPNQAEAQQWIEAVAKLIPSAKERKLR